MAASPWRSRHVTEPSCACRVRIAWPSCHCRRRVWLPQCQALPGGVRLKGMRVISGAAKGKRLRAVPGSGTRPITDRVKESVFDILGDLEGVRFLDLFSGTGGVAIEALSRGAECATLVERSAVAAGVIRENLRSTGMAKAATLVQADVFRYLESTRDEFDVVYVAPPQYKGLWKETLRALDREASPAVDLVVVQIHPKEYEPLCLTHLELEETRRYGSTMICLYRRVGGG